MKAVIQRVSQASVCIKGQIYSQIQQGLLIFLGIEHSDKEQDVEWLSKKIANLRIFADEKALENVLREGNMLTFTAVDLGSMPFREQIKLVRSSNMLVKEDQWQLV